jgi:zinc protease
VRPTWGWLLSACLVCALVNPAWSYGPIRKVLLKNGFRLVTQEDHALPLVGICLGVGVGPSNEPKEIAGASFLLTNAFLEAPADSQPGKRWRKILELSGVETGVDCQKEHSFIRLEVPAELLDSTLENLALVVFNPTWTPKCLETVRARQLRHIAQETEFPATSDLVPHRLEHLAYGEHPYGREEEGSVESLNRMSVPLLTEFQRKYFVPNNMVLTLVGSVDSQAILPTIQKYFGQAGAVPLNREAVAPVPVPGAGRKDAIGAQVDNAVVSLGFVTVPGAHADTPAVELARCLLAEGRASAFQRSLITKGRASRVTSSLPLTARASLVSFRVDVRGASAAGILDDMVTDIERLRRQEVSREELDRARTYWLAQQALHHQHDASQAIMLTRFEMIDEVYAADALKTAIARVTPADVRRAALQYLDPDRAFSVTLEPPRVQQKTTQHQVYRLPNGMTLVVRSRPGLDVVGISVLASAGGRREPEHQRGLSHVLARVMAEGNTRRHSAEETTVALESIGSRLQHFTIPDAVIFTSNATLESLESVLEILNEIVTEPVFSAGAVAQERTKFLEKLKELASNPDLGGVLDLRRELYQGHPYATEGDATTLASIGPKDVRAHWEAIFQPNNVTLSLSGSLDPQTMRDRVTRIFASFKETGPAAKPRMVPYVPLTATNVKIVPSGRPADHLFVGWKLPKQSDAQFAPITVCFRSLGLGKQALLERKLAGLDPTYQRLFLNYNIMEDSSVILMGWRLKPGAGKAAVKAVEESVAELMGPGPAPDDCADTRDMVLNHFLHEEEDVLEDASDQAVALAVLHDKNFFQELAPHYRAVTPAAVKAVANQYFKNYQVVLFEGKAP